MYTDTHTRLLGVCKRHTCLPSAAHLQQMSWHASKMQTQCLRGTTEIMSRSSPHLAIFDSLVCNRFANLCSYPARRARKHPPKKLLETKPVGCSMKTISTALCHEYGLATSEPSGATRNTPTSKSSPSSEEHPGPARDKRRGGMYNAHIHTHTHTHTHEVGLLVSDASIVHCDDSLFWEHEMRSACQ